MPKITTDNQFAENVKSARKSAGLTREQLAVRMGISLTTVQRIESGRQSPRLATARKLAEHLGVTLEYLLII